MDTPSPPPSPPAEPSRTVRVEFLAPLTPAWERMRRILFPFDVRTWCTVGFGCFLAKLVEGGTGGGGAGTSGGVDQSNAAPSSARFPVDLHSLDWSRLAEHTVGMLAGHFGVQIDEAWSGAMMATVIAGIIAAVLALVVLLIYLSARGHFVFLDNVALERAAFRVPWGEYRREGHSLFLWRLGFVGVTFALFLVVLLLPFLVYLSMEDTLGSEVGIALLVLWILLVCLPLILVTAYVDLWLTEFVVPVMFRHRLTATAAWGRFLPLLRAHAFDFLAWGLLIFVLHVLVGMAVFAAGIATCCIGLLLVLIPYVGTVLLLPLHLTYRAYSLEFLAQYGEQWWSFPPPWESGTSPSPPPETPLSESAEPEPPRPPTTPS